MLDALRKGAGTWVAKIFIALLIFSFGVWGVSGFLTGVGQNTAARVGDAEITLFDLDRTYRQDLNRLSQQFGRQLSPSEGAMLGVPQQTLGKLISEAALNTTASEMKLGISDERLARMIQTDPAFRGVGGGYDKNRLQQVLQSNGYREDEYVVQRRRIAERSQLAEALSGGLKAPRAYVKAFDTFQRESRDVDYLLVTPATIGEIADPAEDALTTYFEEHLAEFRAPEYREIRYIAMTPDSLARPDDIATADAEAEYERRKDDFHQAERRKVRQLSFPSEEAAGEAAAALAGGKTFDELMAERNLSANDVALGTMARADFLDEAIGEAAFALQEGETSGVVDGRFSTVIVNVEEIQPESTRPFDEVRAEVVGDLAREQAEREVLGLLDEVEDARAGGAMLDEIAERFSLPLDTPAAFDPSGNGMDGAKVSLPEAEGLVDGAFESDIGIENDALQLGAQGFVWYDVVNVTPARDRTLDEVREDVVAAWKKEELERRLDARADELLAEARAGAPLASVATGAGLEVETVTGVTRSAPSGDLGRDALAAVFGGPSGTFAMAPSADGSARLVLSVTGVHAPEEDPEARQVAAIDQQLSQQLSDTLLGQFISEREDAAGVEINNAGVSQVLGLNGN